MFMNICATHHDDDDEKDILCKHMKMLCRVMFFALQLTNFCRAECNSYEILHLFNSITTTTTANKNVAYSHDELVVIPSIIT